MIIYIVYSINRKQFLQWAEQLGRLFGDNSEIYFVPHRSVNKIKLNATGKLWENFNHIKNVLRKEGLLKTKRESANDVSETENKLLILF